MNNQPTNKQTLPNGVSMPDEGKSFNASWRPLPESHMFHLYPLALLVAAAISWAVFGNSVLTVFLIVLCVAYCVFSLVFRNDERFKRYLWLTGDEYENGAIRCFNGFGESLEAVGLTDKFTRCDEAWYDLEEYDDTKVVFLFSTTQPGKTPAVVSKSFERIAPVFRAYSTKVEEVDAVTYRITYLFDSPAETLGKTYLYQPSGTDRG